MNGADITHTLIIGGEPYNLRYDIQAMSDVEQSLELMKGGVSKKSFFDLLDMPYDIRELVVMLMAGIKGYNRFSNIKSDMNFNDATKILENHFRTVSEICETPQEFVSAQNKLMEEISVAARKAVGFKIKEKPEVKN